MEPYLLCFKNDRTNEYSKCVGALTGLCLGFLKAFLSKENAVPLKWIFQNKEIRSAIILVILLTIFSVYIDKGLLQLTF